MRLIDVVVAEALQEHRRLRLGIGQRLGKKTQMRKHRDVPLALRFAALGLTASAFGLALGPRMSAETWPSQPVKLIVSQPADGTLNIMRRPITRQRTLTRLGLTL